MPDAIVDILDGTPKWVKIMTVLLFTFSLGGSTTLFIAGHAGLPDTVEAMAHTMDSMAAVSKSAVQGVASLSDRVDTLERVTAEGTELLRAIDRRLCIVLADTEREKTECANR